MSLLESKILKDCIDEQAYETIELKKLKADKIKEDKQRLKDKIKRYEVYFYLFSNSSSTKPVKIIRTRCTNSKMPCNKNSES